MSLPGTPTEVPPADAAQLQAKRWARRSGALLIVLGAALALGIGGLLWWMAPMLLDPGVEYTSGRFTGSKSDAMMIFSLLSAVFVFGATAFGYGIWLVLTGRRSIAPVAVMLAIAGGLYLFAILMR